MKKLADQLVDEKEFRVNKMLKSESDRKFNRLVKNIEIRMDLHNSNYYIYDPIYYYNEFEKLVTEDVMKKLENEGFTVKRLWLRNKWKISWGD